MGHYSNKKVERERTNIKQSGELSKESRELLKFDDEIAIRRGPGNQFSLARHYALLAHTRLLGERTNHLSEVIIDEDCRPEDRKAAKAAGQTSYGTSNSSLHMATPATRRSRV